MQLILKLAIALGIISTPLSAFAAPTGWTNHATANKLWFGGLPNTTTQGVIVGPQMGKKTANQCGVVAAKYPGATYYSVNATSYDPAAIASTVIPKCKNTNGTWALETAMTGVMKDSAGNLYFPGQTPGAVVEIFHNAPKNISLRFNGCGFTSVKVDHTTQPTVTVGSSSLQTPVNPPTDSPWICKGSQAYKPVVGDGGGSSGGGSGGGSNTGGMGGGGS